MRIPNNVIAFAGEKTDIYEGFMDYFNHYKAINGKTGIDYDKTLSFSEKETKIHENILKEAKRISGIENFAGISPEMLITNPTYKWALFAVVSAMVDMILPETVIDSVGLFTEVRTGGYGDNFLFEIKPRDLFVVTKGAKGKKHGFAQKQFTGSITITPEEHEIAVEVSLFRVLTGKENLADFAMKAARSMDLEMAKDCYVAFATAMNALPYMATPDGTELRIAGFTQDSSIALAQKVTAYNGGAKAIFLGTQLAVSKILPNATANYRVNIESDYVKTGYLRDFMGTSIMVLEQVADWTTPFKMVLDDKKIYVLSPSAGKIVKLCIEGSTLTFADSADANANLTQKTTVKKFWGTGIAVSAIAGEIELA